MDDSDIAGTINDLIETCKDGEYGFNACSEQLKSPDLKTMFGERAAECRKAAQELQALVGDYGGKPDTHGSVSGALHRGWVAVKGTLSGFSEEAVLSECERGEDAAKATYSKALAKGLPAAVQAVVQRQYEGVLRNHLQVKELRNAAHAKAKAK